MALVAVTAEKNTTGIHWKQYLLLLIILLYPLMLTTKTIKLLHVYVTALERSAATAAGLFKCRVMFTSKRRYEMTLLPLRQCSLSSTTVEQDCLYQIKNLSLYILICSSSILGFPELPLSPFLTTANYHKVHLWHIFNVGCLQRSSVVIFFNDFKKKKKTMVCYSRLFYYKWSSSRR